jgi:hypothetical protein
MLAPKKRPDLRRLAAPLLMFTALLCAALVVIDLRDANLFYRKVSSPPWLLKPEETDQHNTNGGGTDTDTLQATTAIVQEPPPPDDYLAICLAVKDQSQDLPEWIYHHYFNMRIGHIYIMDDGSDPPMSSFADSFLVPAEALTFEYYNASQRVQWMQYHLYDECIEKWGEKHTWMAFIDADEFFDNPGKESIQDVLRTFEDDPNVGAVGVNWQMHTSNGRITRAQSVLAGYTECIFDDEENQGQGSDNQHVKSIVKTQLYGHAVSPHNFETKSGSVTVGESGDPIPYAYRTPISRERISLHHYAVKSYEEYEGKMHRGNAMSQPKGWEFWNHVEHEIPHVHCTEMSRWTTDIEGRRS